MIVHAEVLYGNSRKNCLNMETKQTKSGRKLSFAKKAISFSEK